jgi:DNA-binding HxlR family transcriptional regulator
MPQIPPPKRHPYDQWSPDARALDLVGDKWTLLIIRDLAAGPRRFVELQRVLPGISTEQLRSRLNRMVADGMLTRKRYREVPPRVDYELTPRAKDLTPVLASLALWGYKWAWSQPRHGERVDLGAIFRLAPGLCEPGSDRARSGASSATVTARVGGCRLQSCCLTTELTSTSRRAVPPMPRSAGIPAPGWRRCRPTATPPSSRSTAIKSSPCTCSPVSLGPTVTAL